MTTRRGLLAAMLAAAAAPAIVRASSLMPIYVPKREPIWLGADLAMGDDWTVEHLQNFDGIWQHVATVRRGGDLKHFVNGEEVARERAPAGLQPFLWMPQGPDQPALVDNLRITKIARAPATFDVGRAPAVLAPPGARFDPENFGVIAAVPR